MPSRNLLLSRVSGKLLIITWYYTVYRNCKCSLQSEHHTYLIIREGSRAQAQPAQSLLVCRLLWPALVPNTKVTRSGLARAEGRGRRLHSTPAVSGKVCALRQWSPTAALRHTWASLQQAEGGRSDLYVSTSPARALPSAVCDSRLCMLLALINVTLLILSEKIRLSRCVGAHKCLYLHLGQGISVPTGPELKGKPMSPWEKGSPGTGPDPEHWLKICLLSSWRDTAGFWVNSDSCPTNWRFSRAIIQY